MEKVIYRYNLDVEKAQSQVCIPLHRGDTSVIFQFTLSRGGEHYEISDDCIARFICNKADGTVIFENCIIGNSCGHKIVTYDVGVSRQLSAAAGLHECEIRLYSSTAAGGERGSLLTSARFNILVDEQVVSDEEIISRDNIVLSEVISKLDESVVASENTASSAQAAAESAASAEGEAWQAVAEVSKKAKEVEEAALVTIELKDEMQGIANEAKTATQEANKAAYDANQAAINANAVREEVEAGGYIESLKEMNEGEKFSFWVGTQAEYDADPDKLTENRLHLITDEKISLSDIGIHHYSGNIVLENDLSANSTIEVQLSCTSVFGLSAMPSNLIIASCDSRTINIFCAISHSKGDDAFTVKFRNISGITISAGYEIWYTLIALEV